MFELSIRSAIRKSGKTYRAIAEASGLDLSTLVRLAQAKTDRDYNATLRTIDALCRVLGCRPERVMRYKKG